MKKFLIISLGIFAVFSLSAKKKTGNFINERSYSYRHATTKGSGVKDVEYNGKRVVRIDDNEFKYTFQNFTDLDVDITVGKPHMVVTADDHILNNLDIIQENGQITLKYIKNVNGHGTSGKVKLRLEDISGVSNFGTAVMTVGKMDGTAIDINSFGTGDIYVKIVDGTRVNIVGCGTGDIILDNVDGTTVSATLNGTGDIKIGKVDSTSLEVVLLGTGDIGVGNVDSTNVYVVNGGTGDISVSGDCVTLNTNLTGSGDIYLRNLQSLRSNRVLSGSGEFHY